jgi:hypothetical protein
MGCINSNLQQPIQNSNFNFMHNMDYFVGELYNSVNLRRYQSLHDNKGRFISYRTHEGQAQPTVSPTKLMRIGRVLGTGGFAIVNELEYVELKSDPLHTPATNKPSITQSTKDNWRLQQTNSIGEGGKQYQLLGIGNPSKNEMGESEYFNSCCFPTIGNATEGMRPLPQQSASTESAIEDGTTSMSWWKHKTFALKTLSKYEILQRPTGLTNLYTELNILIQLNSPRQFSWKSVSTEQRKTNHHHDPNSGQNFICRVHAAFHDHIYAYMILDIGELGGKYIEHLRYCSDNIHR